MSDRPVVPEPSDVVESVAESAAGPAAVEPSAVDVLAGAAGPAAPAGAAGSVESSAVAAALSEEAAGPVTGSAAVVVLGVTEARNRLYQLVDAARDDGQVVVVEKRDAKARHTYRAALIPVARLDAGSRARLSGWPSWARTAARPKLGDLVVEAGDSPVRRGVPQVLLERTTPLAVLVEASLVPPGDVLVAVPGEALTDAGVADAAPLPSAAPGAAEGPAAPVVGPGTSLAASGAAEDSSPVRAAAAPVVGPGTSLAASGAAEDSSPVRAAAAPGHAPAPALDDATAVPAAAGGGDPQGAGQRESDQAAEVEQAGHAAAQEAVGGQDAGGTAGEDGTAASARTPEVPPPVPAAGGGLHRLHGLGEVAGLALTEAVAPPAVPRFGFGLRALDAVLGSLPSGVLTVVAAEPHAGGSLLAVHAARHTALTHQLPVLYAASGPSRTAVALRVIAAEAELDYRRLRTGALTEDEQQAAAQVQARLTAADLHVDDGTGLSAEAIAETAPYVEGLALVVVDRFQHAADPFIPLSGSALPEAARVLAHLARTRNVPVVAVLDTADPDVLAALDAAHLTLTLTRTGNDAQVAVAERDFGELTRVPLRADLACARFTDPPEPVSRFDAARAFGGAEGEKVTADLADAVRPYMEAGALEQLPDALRGVLAALVHHLDEERAGDEWTVSELSSSQR
ncbi:DnaB-like helicase C-terminal domain-containing protein, partial [Streptomyces canus]|uniref:DnaB-like helicase C-terminal domain-containing protein n=1 Tax=Streptomyces canus TaxID=58343 RepID=UPI000AE78DE4